MVNGQPLYTVIVRAVAHDEIARATRADIFMDVGGWVSCTGERQLQNSTASVSIYEELLYAHVDDEER